MLKEQEVKESMSNLNKCGSVWLKQSKREESGYKHKPDYIVF